MESNSIKFRIFKSRSIHYTVCFLAALTCVPLFAILGKVVYEGWSQMGATFSTIANGIIGTLLMLIIAVIVAVPVGILCGVYLSENKESRVAQIISYMTDLLQGTPSIIIGIIVYIWVVVPTKGYSGLAGSVALFIMMLPLIIRSTEETLKMLPVSLKEAGLALGGSYQRVILKVLLPSAFGGVFTGVLLAVSRVIGETAPLMFTALGCSIMQWDVRRPMSAVPLLIWEFFNDPNMQNMVWSASLLLLVFVLILNLTAK